MKNHYHITVKCDADELKMLATKLKAKAVNIDLWNNQTQQTHRMITKYHRDLNKLKELANKDINILKTLGFEVIRLKIEEVVEEPLLSDISKCEYLEGHIKVNSKDVLPEVVGFVLSKNNDKHNTRFYNFRIRDSQDFDRVLNGLKTILANRVISTEYEKVIFDSNISCDRWWA